MKLDEARVLCDRLPEVDRLEVSIDDEVICLNERETDELKNALSLIFQRRIIDQMKRTHYCLRSERCTLS